MKKMLLIIVSILILSCQTVELKDDFEKIYFNVQRDEYKKHYIITHSLGKNLKIASIINFLKEPNTELLAFEVFFKDLSIMNYKTIYFSDGTKLEAQNTGYVSMTGPWWANKSTFAIDESILDKIFKIAGGSDFIKVKVGTSKIVEISVEELRNFLNRYKNFKKKENFKNLKKLKL